MSFFKDSEDIRQDERLQREFDLHELLNIAKLIETTRDIKWLHGEEIDATLLKIADRIRGRKK